MTPESEVQETSKIEAESRTLQVMIGEIRGWARDVFFAIGTAVFLALRVVKKRTDWLSVAGR